MMRQDAKAEPFAPMRNSDHIPLDSGRPCAYFSEGRQILENARVVHPGAQSFAEGSKPIEFI